MTSPPDAKAPRPLVLLCGGRSAEHDVSLMSAGAALDSLEPGRLDVTIVGIDRDGRSLAPEPLRKRLGRAAGRARCPEISDWIEFLGSLGPEPPVVFPLLHGPYGEDGTVQGLLDLLDLPYVGAGVGGSAVGMNKIYTKAILHNGGVPVLPCQTLTAVDWKRDPGAVVDRCLPLGLPLFVKPSSMGSSVGITRARDADQLKAGIELALRYDDHVLVERGLDARELEISVMGNLEPEASVPGEIVPGDEFYTYEAKYVDDTSGLVIPAPLEKAQTQQIRELALLSYRLLQLEGMARVDFLMEKENKTVWLNEVNTIPGFTPISMYPKMWEAAGLAYTDLIERLMDLALERRSRRARFSTGR